MAWFRYECTDLIDQHVRKSRIQQVCILFNGPAMYPIGQHRNGIIQLQDRCLSLMAVIKNEGQNLPQDQQARLCSGVHQLVFWFDR